MASAAAEPLERPEMQFVSKLSPDSCLTFYRRLYVVPAAVVTHFGVLACIYLAIQNRSRSEAADQGKPVLEWYFARIFRAAACL